MNIILCTKSSKNPSCFNINHGRLVALAFLIFVVLPAGMMYAGFQMGEVNARNQILPDAWQEEIVSNREEIAEVARITRENMNALTLRLGQLQAQAVRLNALGKRLVKSGKLDHGEFDFSQPPGQGGPLASGTDSELMTQLQAPDFIASLEALERQLNDRERQLRLLESFFMARTLRSEVVPQGRPIANGWLSSYYGMRTDPFSGLQEHHKGVDFAGKQGASVIASASGVITWSGKRYGYGLMVEINHGNGYATRYAHNFENMVKVGDVVKKGEVIAKMGSSGRSTGPHVHYEVIFKGRTVDPAKYIQASR